MNAFDFLISIPGPEFLIYFIFMSIACIITGRWIAFHDGTEKYPLPDARALDFIEIAVMRGGRTAVLQAAIFIFFKKRRRVSELFTDREITEVIDVYLGSAYQKLEIMGLMLNKNGRLRIMTVFCIAFLVIFGIGLAKLYFGLKYGRPVAFLVILLFLSFLGILTAFNPFKKRRTSRLGIKYLNFLHHHFSWLKQAVTKGDDIPSFNPALFGVAIFGVTFIAGMEFFSPFSSAFPSDFSGDSISGGGYDGSTDSGGGGCSDGGGGCGGCGGGD
ncbi:TIGR04222 domain-containing membrane protein [Desulforegula conservatrix]|uniref:TIGR04222 domain-containing membrane protein n=1 Tax=Desulforegula conservatrix TaxID=153026 RepID=UPI0003FCB5BD|nr:TIGR04222 domain-containing membrane protein [Desulforegula conservatrix]